MVASAGNPVKVGPYQRIVDFHWPDPAPKYIEAALTFFNNSNYAVEYGDVTPKPLWTDSFGVCPEYCTGFAIGFDALADFPVAGTPGYQAQAFGAWEYVDQRTFVGHFIANFAYMVNALSGPEIADSPLFFGTRYRQQLSMTVDSYRTPFVGTNLQYSNLSFYDGVGEPVLRRFDGRSSYEDVSLAGTVLVGSMTFDFSGMTATYLGRSYSAVGLNLRYISTYGIDADRGTSFRILFEKNPA